VIRRNIKVGDKTTSGAEVMQGIERVSHHGVRISFLGAKIYCHVCESEGFIVGRGPRRNVNLMGKRPALEYDLGVCNASRLHGSLPRKTICSSRLRRMSLPRWAFRRQVAHCQMSRRPP
jgi:uncharacterized Zn-binding protein involved in type VI secretion